MKTKRNLIQTWLLCAALSTLNLQPSTAFAQPVTKIAAGQGHSLFLKSDGSLWGMGRNQYGELGDGTSNYYTNRPEQIVAGVPPGFDRISCQFLSNGRVCLSFVGMAGTNYALDRSFSLSPAKWVPQATNPGGASGMVVFTNPPDAATNNFWRVRSVP